MRVIDLWLDRYDWSVRVFVKVTHIDTRMVIANLRNTGCPKDDLRKSWRMLESGKMNNGICFPNAYERRSIMVLTRTSTPDEFFDSIVHEMGHFASQIAQIDGISQIGEEIRYLQGDFARSLYPHIKDLLCCKCH